MKRLILGLVILAIIVLYPSEKPLEQIVSPQPIEEGFNIYKKFPELITWQRPIGPIKIALQVGHWKNDDFPEELAHLRDNDGTQWGKNLEVDVNYTIAQNTAKLLEKEGFQVEILPATVPPGYLADVFVSIHADGNENKKIQGFKVTGPLKDFSGKSKRLSDTIAQEYQVKTKLFSDIENISPNMLLYYAFSYDRFNHSIHPMTPAAIVETGYLTNAKDRTIIVNQPQKAAEGIAEGIRKFLHLEIAEGNLKPSS